MVEVSFVVKETGIPGENNWPAGSHGHNFFYKDCKAVSCTTLYDLGMELRMLVLIGTNIISRTKCNYKKISLTGSVIHFPPIS